MSPETWVAVGTGILALATFVLAGITAWNVRKTGGLVTATERSADAANKTIDEIKKDRELAHRPLLADPKPNFEGAKDIVLFGEPNQVVESMPRDSRWMSLNGDLVSLPFRNVGAGVAVVTKAETDPPVNGTVHASRKFVPVGEHVRVNITRAMDYDPARTIAGLFETLPFAVLIHYTDASGTQALISRADFASRVETISIFKEGEPKPFVVGKTTMH